jgi:glycosyltransferase involved in cell wall biosynthesis
MADKTEALAAEIGEKDRTIIFLDWVSYDDFQALLCEADVGISLHPVHVETRYSIRTRLLSYIWARLPVVVTEGDVTSEWVEQFQIGVVVPAFDDEAVAEGLNRLLDTAKSDWEKAFDPLLERYPWSKVVEPLRRFCLEGAYAPDRQERAIPIQPVARSSSAWARAYFILRRDGPKALAHRAWRYLQWRMSRP